MALTHKKLGERIRDFMIDHNEFERVVTSFIEAVDPKSISGKEKKDIVLEKIRVWLDEKIALKGFWEMLSDLVIRFALLFISGWVESIFDRWKLSKQADSQPVVDIPTAGGVLSKRVVRKKTFAPEE